jgi:predicted metal-dependent peptidase
MDPEWPADPQFADLAAEVIYSRMPPPQPEDDGDGDDGDGDGDGQRQEGGQGWQDGRQGASGQEGSADISPSDVEAPQPPADGSESGQEIAERLDAQWQMAVQQAVNAALQQGNVPASMQSAIDEMKRARGDWRNELRHLLHSVSHDDYTWRMPSQRYMARGLYLPSLRDERMDCAVFVRDTSGSISDDTLAKGNAEIFAAIDEVKPRRVIIMDCDAAVAKVWEVDEGDDVPELKQAFGRGGTSFVPPFDWLRERDITPAVLIYLTDLEGGFPAEPGFPTIWCATNRLTSPIGRTLHIL